MSIRANGIRHRLIDIDPILYLLNDDGAPGITIIIHGAGLGERLLSRPDVDEAACDISEAQIPGRVYLLSWRSGGPRRYYNLLENNAHRLGQSLRSLLLKIPAVGRHKLTLMGHSLGGHVAMSGLLSAEWKPLKLHDIVLLGTALSDQDFENISATEVWRQCLREIGGKIYNCHNRYDFALWVRRIARWFGPESIGRCKTSYKSSRIVNLSFTGRLNDGYEHGYLNVLNWVLDKVYPRRVRSRNYPIRALCDCPHCDESLIVTADTNEICPECRMEFEYRSIDWRCYWSEKPELMECPECDGPTGVLIQESGLYSCPDCRRSIRFRREGRKIKWE